MATVIKEEEEMANEFKKLQQHARELAPEVDSEQEFLEAFGFGSVCERCGRKGLDDEHETDCQLTPNPDDPDGPWLLICHECFTEADRAAREQA